MTTTDWVGIRLGQVESEKLAEDIISTLLPVPSEILTSRELREYWEVSLLSDSWVKGLQVKNSHLSIGFCKAKVGLCIQLGNVARVYADLLKLETLFRQGLIETGVLIVPSDSYSNSLGQNYARYSRAHKDILSFTPTLSAPYLLISFDNRKG